MSGLRFLDQTLFGALVEQAAANPRQRQHHNFHQMEEPCHRMAIGLQPDTYIPPHRHLSADKAEALLVLKGRLGVLIFNDVGEVLDKRVLQAGGECASVSTCRLEYFMLLWCWKPTAFSSNAKPGPTNLWGTASRPTGRRVKVSWRRRLPGLDARTIHLIR